MDTSIEDLEQPLLDILDCNMFKELGNLGRPIKTFNEVERKMVDLLKTWLQRELSAKVELKAPLDRWDNDD